MTHPSISLIVPVFNSEGSLEALVDRIATALRDFEEKELILVNDGSRDQSWKVVESLCRKHEWVRGIDLMRNYGQHNAVLAGIRAARHSVSVTLDDDLQNPPEEIPRMVALLESQVDVVYGVPQKQQHGLLRDLASSITKLTLKHAMGAEIAQNISAFRVFRTQLRDAFADHRSPTVNVDVLLTWGTTRFAMVRVQHDQRAVGVTNYTFRKLLAHAFNMMTGFSTLPLQLASVVGFGFTLFGVGVLMFVVIRYFLSGDSVPGFPFLASIIAMFSGAQLLSLGIIGEYLARMHFRTLDKPAYVVRSGGEQLKPTPVPHALER